MFRGHDAPDPALVRAVLDSYRDPASSNATLRADDELAARHVEHGEMVGLLVEYGHRLGLRAHVSAHEQRRAFRARTVGDLLSDEEQRAYLPLIAPRDPQTFESLDCIWYLRGKATFLFEVEWTAMLTDALLRRGQRIPNDDTVVRFLVIPAERTELVRTKLARSPLLAQALEEQNWHILKFDHLRRLVAAEEADLDLLAPMLGPGSRDRTRSGAARPVRLRRDSSDRLWSVSVRCSTSPTASGSGSCRASRCTPRSSATSATTIGCPIRSAAGRADEVVALKGFLADADQIDRRPLEQEDAITLDMLEVVARIWLRQQEHNVHHFEAMDQMAGPHNLPGDLARFQRLDTPERVDRLIRRLEQFPDYLAEHRANLLDGIAAGRTAAAPVVARVIEQVRRAVAAPGRRIAAAGRPSRAGCRDARAHPTADRGVGHAGARRPSRRARGLRAVCPHR